MNVALPIPSSTLLRHALVEAWHDHLLHVILVIFLALAFAWNFVTPVFEAPDEPDHLQYVLFVADEGRLPDLQTDIQRAGIESPQPPLYYFIMGAVVRLSGVSHPYIHPVRNPDFDFDPVKGAANYYIPVTDTYNYVHLLRGFSTIFGLIVVICTYLTAALLGATRLLRLGATSLTAFLPQFTFISSAVSNDLLTAAVTSVTIVWLLYLIQLKTPRGRQTIICGALTGLAFLGKSHVIFLLPFAIVMFMFTNTNGHKQLLKDIVWSAAGFLLISMWYLIHNQLRYGDFTAVNMQAAIVPDLVVRKTLLEPGGRMSIGVALPLLLFKSFLGAFGWMKLFLPGVFYQAFAILWLCALVGVVRGVFKKNWDRVREGLIFAPLMAFLVIVYINFTFLAPQGRYFFPELAIISVIFVFGIAELPAIMRRSLFVAAPLFLLLANVYSLWYVASVYQ